jgi:hypothetical protein
MSPDPIKSREDFYERLAQRNALLAQRVPAWLSRFVREEARLLLVTHYEIAIEAVNRWHELQMERERKRELWKEKQRMFLRNLPAVSARTQDLPDRTAEGLVYIEDTVSRWRNGEQVSETVGGWGLPYLAGSGPPVDFPLPPPKHRILSTDESFTALLAIHDVTNPGNELIDHTKLDTFSRLRQKVLVNTVVGEQGLVEDQLPALQAIVKIVADCVSGDLPPAQTMTPRTSVGLEPKPSVPAAGAAQIPDGPVGMTGFSFRGVEVQFGRAVKQLSLVRALWNTTASRPREPRLIEDVISEVWGDENNP